MNVEQALRQWFDTYVATSEDIGTQYFADAYDSKFPYQVESLFSAMCGRDEEDGIPPAPLPRVWEVEMVPTYNRHGASKGYILSIPAPSPGPYRRQLTVEVPWNELTKDRQATGTAAAWDTVEGLGDAWLNLTYGVE